MRVPRVRSAAVAFALACTSLSTGAIAKPSGGAAASPESSGNSKASEPPVAPAPRPKPTKPEDAPPRKQAKTEDAPRRAEPSRPVPVPEAAPSKPPRAEDAAPPRKTAKSEDAPTPRKAPKTDDAPKPAPVAKTAAPKSAPEAKPVSPPAEPVAGSPSEPESLPSDAAGPGVGQGERRIKSVERPEATASTDGSKKQSAATANPSHRKGSAPKHPNPMLPAGAAPAKPDDDARRQIAGGPTVDDLAQGKPDPQLRELSDAERALFPRPLRGARTGFSWDVPEPIDDDSPTVIASGLPPLAGTVAEPKDTRDAEFIKSLALPNLPVRFDARVVKYLKFYRDDPRGKNILRIWAKKCGRLLPALRAELAKAGLPTDLVYLSLIESGHNPTIMSPVGAAGLWQFMPESARLYGLTVDRWVDERLDPERATLAAARYLNDLHSRFGSWDLAMAAYNMGHGGLLRALRKFNTNDFWALSRYEAGLPWETTLYVPKILATAVAMNNKAAFGIDDVEADAPISFDTVAVGPNVDLADVARAAEITLEDARALNPEYLALRTPQTGTSASRFPVHVPPGRGLVTEQRLASLGPRQSRPTEPHVVRFGDTLETIAAEHGAASRDIGQLNHVDADSRLAVGTVLLVPQAPVSMKDAPPGDEGVVVVPGRRFMEQKRKRVFYRVLPGDHVAEIAAAFSVAPSELAAWNAVDPQASLQPGMSLQILVPEDADLSRVRVLGEHEVRVLVAGSAEFFDYFEAQNGRKRLTVTAKKGETLAAIGKRYGMTAAMMERINRVPSQTALDAGDRVVVYTKGDREPGTTSDADLARELSQIVAPFPDALPRLPDPTAANATLLP